MSIIFGPVNSRRFGTSLGVDLSPNMKCCNFDCLYCELKASKTLDMIINPPLVKDIIKELKIALNENTNIDFITLTANGEPSLYPNLKNLIREINKIKTTQKILILSNGTAVLNQEKLNALQDIDVVKFSLDSIIQKSFKKIDNPLGNIQVNDIVEKMINFRTSFKGELVLEILVVKDINDTKEEFVALNSAISKIKPNRVDISTIDRPPSHRVKPVEKEILDDLSKFIKSAPITIAHKKKNINKFDFTEIELLKTLSLRPQSSIDVEQNFSEKSKNILENLLKDKKIKIVKLAGLDFYKLA